MEANERASFSIQAIGVIRTPFSHPDEVPRQPALARAAVGTVEVFPEYGEGFKDLDGFSHVVLVYYFHRADELDEVRMVRRPFLDDEEHGIFAMRYPVRPNPIGLSVVRLVSVGACVLDVEGIDVLDGTPLLDVKPHVPKFHAPGDLKQGWVDTKRRAR